MAEDLTYWEGKWSQAEPPISYFNRAFRFGDGVFETIKHFNGKSPFLDFHLARLSASCEALKIEFTTKDETYLRSALERISEQEAYKQAIIRIWAFRKGEGKYTPNTSEVELVLRAEPSNQASFQLNQKGLTIDLANSVIVDTNQYSSLKSMNSLTYVMASIEKMKRGYDDLLLQNQQGEILEACSSNLFLVSNNVLYTPPLASGILNGVMRRVIIQLANQNSWRVEQKAFSLADLQHADELFLTNSVSGIRWVKAFRKKRYFHKVSSILIEILNKEL